MFFVNCFLCTLVQHISLCFTNFKLKEEDSTQDDEMNMEVRAVSRVSRLSAKSNRQTTRHSSASSRR